jgi:DNA polymerase theta
MRILTHLCKDPKLLKIFKSAGEDIFKKIGASWNNVDESSVSETQRNQTKQLCYGIIYGMGSKALAETMKVDEETAKTLADEFQSSYPGINSYRDKLFEKVRQKGFVETITSRRRYFPEINSKDAGQRSQAERRAFNTCIQGSASDLVKSAMIRMEKNIKLRNLEDCKLVLHMHDELLYEVPSEKMIDAARLLIESMENCVVLKIPLKVKVKSGKNWGEMTEMSIDR